MIFNMLCIETQVLASVDDITGFDAADLDRDLIAERLKKDDVWFWQFIQHSHVILLTVSNLFILTG